MTSDHGDGRGVSRRKVLECMTWAGTGVLWTIAGGMPRSMGIIGEAMAAEPSGLTFLQISDSHVGFDKPANPNALGTLEEAVNKIKTMPVKPSFVIHTGDITHLSKPSEFDDADREFRRAEFLFPEHPYALTGRIRLAVARGQHAEALQLLRRAPATPESLAMRGDLQAHLGDRAAAAASYQESERLEREGWASEQPQPGALARFLAERDRNIPEAVALAERAAAERQDIHTMDAMAWAYFKAGRLADADAAIGRAMRTGTVDPRIRCHATAIAEARRGGTPGRCDPLKPQA